MNNNYNVATTQHTSTNKEGLSKGCNLMKTKPTFNNKLLSRRDSYIVHDKGGLVKHFTPLNSLGLNSYLRNNVIINLNNKKNINCKGPNRQSNDLLFKIQKSVTDRLYNNEKRKFLPMIYKNKATIINNNNSIDNNTRNKTNAFIPYLRAYYDVKHIDTKKPHHEGVVVKLIKSKSIDYNNNEHKYSYIESLRKRLQLNNNK